MIDTPTTCVSVLAIDKAAYNSAFLTVTPAKLHVIIAGCGMAQQQDSHRNKKVKVKEVTPLCSDYGHRVNRIYLSLGVGRLKRNMIQTLCTTDLGAGRNTSSIHGHPMRYDRAGHLKGLRRFNPLITRLTPGLITYNRHRIR